MNFFSCYSPFISSFTLQEEESFSDGSQSSDPSESGSECESSSDFLATSASDFHHRSMLSMLHKLGAALNQVNNELRQIGPILPHVKDELRQIGPILPHVKDELRQIGPILPQLMAQIRKSARQQQRVEVALLAGSCLHTQNGGYLTQTSTDFPA
jgi:hypothetical protein